MILLFIHLNGSTTIFFYGTKLIEKDTNLSFDVTMSISMLLVFIHMSGFLYGGDLKNWDTLGRFGTLLSQIA